MGYYAHGSGEIMLKKKVPDEILESLEGFNEADQYTRKHHDGTEKYFLSLVHYDDKYHEDCVYDDLRKIEPYTEEGCINFIGEDDIVWRFMFHPDIHEFVEESGKISYDYGENDSIRDRVTGNKLEFLNSIIEVFETFLDEKGIIIDNPDKAQDPNASNIYGCDYGDLESELEHALKGWGVMA